jgi:hypothetical protein
MKKERMKKLLKIVFIGLSAATLIYAVLLYQSIQAYDQWKIDSIKQYVEEFGGTFEFWEGISDFYPFWEYPAHKPFIYSVIILGLLWMLLPVALAGDKNKLAAFFIGAGVCIALLLVPLVQATPQTVHVDVLCIADEEFDNGEIIVPYITPIGTIYVPTPSKEVAEFALEEVSEYFLEEFNIQFH